VFWVCGREEFLPVSRQLGFWVGRAYGSWLVMKDAMDRETPTDHGNSNNSSTNLFIEDVQQAKRILNEWQDLQREFLELRRTADVRQQVRNMLAGMDLTLSGKESENRPSSSQTTPTESRLSSTMGFPEATKTDKDTNYEISESLARTVFQIDREKTSLYNHRQT
jgi:hypothetical protein